MKIAMTTIFIILAFVALMVFTYKKPATIDMGLLYDITDQQISKPNEAEIFSLIDLTGEDKWNGVRFHSSSFSDVSYNPISQIFLQPANHWFVNTFERD